MTKKKIWLFAVGVSAAALAAIPLVPFALGVGTSNWTQTSETDFKAGTFDNVVATNLGDLKLSRAVRMLLSQNPRVSSVNAMVQAPDGTIYAGTGPHAQLLKIVGDEVTELASIDGATHLFALAMDKDGGLLIGASGETGRVLKLAHPSKADEKPVELFKAEGVQYIWALTQTDDGKIYAATGPSGKLFEITGPGQSRVLLDADENNLLSLASDGKDLLYVGTDPNGLVYRVNRKTGDNFIVYDAPEAEVSALVIDKAGNVYAGTSEAREEPLLPKPPGVPAAGRPESQPAGLPIPSKAPTDPEPAKIPDPNPSQPAPIPKAAPELPKPARTIMPIGSTKPTGPDDVATPSPGTPGAGGGEGPASDKPKTQNEPKPADPKPADPTNAQNEPTAAAKFTAAGAQNEPTAVAKPSTPPAQNEPKPAPPASSLNPLGDNEKTAADPLGDVETPAPEPTKPPTPTPPGGAPAPGAAPAAAAPRMIPGRQPAVDALGTGQPRPDGNAIYRIDTDGFVTEVFRQRALVLAMVEKDGILFVATGSEGLVYQVNPSAEETIVLAKVDPKQVTCLLPAKDGNIYMGLANVGGIATIGNGFSRRGSYTSAVLDATQISRFGKMQLHGTLPTGTTLSVSTRSGNVKDATQSSWSKWSDAVPATEFVQVTSPTARFLQYKLAFTSDGDGKTTPVVEDVGIAYQVPNLPPQVKSIKLTAQPEVTTPVPGGDAEPPRVARSPRIQIAWEASDPNADAMRYALHFRRGAGSPWILLRENITETTFDWDTRAVADGRYEIRVTANDARANPPGKGRSASRVSDPVVVDNTAPVIGSITSKANGPAVDVSLRVVDRTSIVSAVDYSVDSAKGWQAVLPSDNIFDSPEEAVSFSVPGLSGGSHQITIRAIDAKGNQAFETLVVTVDTPTAKSE